MSEKPVTEAGYRAGIVEDVRSWGRFRRFPHEDASAVKIITLAPGGRFSLQYHESRDEFWVVLDPGIEITAGDRVWTAAPDEEIFIPRRVRHRARNAGEKAARIMEIWIGPSAESDIVRLPDGDKRN